MVRGDLVALWTLRGVRYGRVERVGPKWVEIRWEGGAVQRFPRGLDFRPIADAKERARVKAAFTAMGGA